ncbi:MAG TPA: lipoyl(octanoyl) transferase LipB [Candidatus Marinimicrobia bacterium]|nr:lipoyl(octanoyl) transferase LipB [Candidatus Neomarinimicrobiota bacterium]
MLTHTSTFNETERPLQVMDLGMSAYQEVWDLQKALQARRISGDIGDRLLLVEHEPVYTLGKNAPRDNLLKPEGNGVLVVQTDRGGDITFHGPGQLVGYPILDLHKYRQSVSWYMRSLEQMLIGALSDFGISAGCKKGLTGVWVRDKKIAALGVRISRWVTMHGFALNVNPDLSFYEGIIPCGIRDFGVTSMANLLGQNPKMSTVKKAVVNHFKVYFFRKDA